MESCYFASGLKCDALIKQQCPGCKWGKTKDQFFSDLKKANERLASLSFERQLGISQQYYNGKRPWGKEV